MYSFIAGGGLEAESARRGVPVSGLLASAAQAVLEQLPELGAPIRIKCTEIPEVGGGWAILRPELPVAEGIVAEGIVSEWCDAEHACLVFGELLERGQPARRVRDAWLEGEACAVARLRGVFSAIVIDRKRRSLHVTTSTPGCRSLHYLSHEGMFAVAPLDLALVALTRCEVRFDRVAMASMAGIGWPLGGAGALAMVRETQLDEQLVWSPAGLKRTAMNPFAGAERVSAHDPQRLRCARDAVIDELQSGVAEALGRLYPDDRPIDVALTAGVDSRAVLALLLAHGEGSRLRTYTRGQGSQDVRIARRISASLGLAHETRAVEPSSLEIFSNNARFLAIATNAVANADAAVGPCFEVARSAPVPLGSGGEAYRGFYYNYLRRRRGRATTPHELARALIASPLRGLASTPFADPHLRSDVQRALQVTLERLACISSNPFDITDLFYIFERMGRWGSSIWRRSLGPCFVPFANGPAMLRLFALPSPVGEHGIVSSIIARHVSRRAYLTPVNGTELLFLEGPGRARYFSRELLRGGGKLLRKARQRLWPGEQSPRQMRQAPLLAAMRELLRDSLLHPRSVGRDLFAADQLERACNSGALNPALATALFSLELFRRSLEQARARKDAWP